MLVTGGNSSAVLGSLARLKLANVLNILVIGTFSLARN